MSLPLPDYGVKGEGEPTLVFLHGLGGNRHYFDATIEHLASRHRCLSWSMPGYADSPRLDEVTFEALATSAVKMLDDAGVDRAIVAGHSAGGMVAQTLWTVAPERIAGLILIGTVPAFTKDERFVRGFLESRLAPIEAGRTPADIAETVIGGLVASPLPEGAMRHACGCMSSISAEAYAAMVRCLTTFDQTATLPTITVPTLLLSATEDRTTPVAAMKQMAQVIPNAEYVEIEGAGHLMDLERPELFRAAIDAFLAKLNGQ